MLDGVPVDLKSLNPDVMEMLGLGGISTLTIQNSGSEVLKKIIVSLANSTRSRIEDSKVERERLKGGRRYMINYSI